MDAVPRATMADVARAAGVARSTVSRALRNDPTIPASRCAEVKQIAAAIGYRSNPMVSALMAQLHYHRRRDDPFNIAWLDLWPNTERSVTVPFWKELLAGARARAITFGFDLEVFCVAQDSLSPARLKKILTARSQWGLIIPPVPEGARYFSLDMRGLTGVTIGTSLCTPLMNRVSSNHYQGAHLASERLRAKGFRRIGLVLSRTIDQRIDGKWSGGFLSAQLSWPARERIAPLLLDSEDHASFEAWLAGANPDAVLLTEPQIVVWLNRQKLKRPPQVAWLALDAGPKHAWGIDHRPEEIGGAAVEQVVGQIYRNTRDSPAVPHTLLLDGLWVET